MEARPHQSLVRDFIKDAFEYSPSFIVPGLMGFIVIPIITRLFPAEVYGNYTLVLATVSLVSTLLGWVAMPIVRFFPAYERQGRTDAFYATVVTVTFFSIGLTALIYMAALHVMRTSLKGKLFDLLLIGLMMVIVTFVFNVLREFLRAKRLVRWYTGFSIWHSVSGFGVGLALIMLARLGIEGLLWGYILSLLVILPVLWFKAVRGAQLKLEYISKQLIADMAKYGLPLMVGNLAAWLLSLSDRYILEAFRGSHEVGVYSASYGISEKSLMLAVSLFSAAVGPIAMRLWEKEGKVASQEFISQSTRLYIVALVPMVVGLSVLAKPIVSVLIGPEYREGYRIMPMVALSVFFLGLTQRFGIGFCYLNVTYYATLAMGVSGLLNLGLNFLLIPKYGYIAAAWTTVVSYACFLALQIILSRRFFVWKFPFQSLARAGTAAALMGLAVYPMGRNLACSNLLNLIVAIPLAAVLYFALLLLLGEIQPNEKRALKQFIARHLPGRFTPVSWKKMP